MDPAVLLVIVTLCGHFDWNSSFKLKCNQEYIKCIDDKKSLIIDYAAQAIALKECILDKKE